MTVSINGKLKCPVRGALEQSIMAKDGLTLSEEARRIELIKFLLKRKYLKDHIEVETVVIKNLGEKGRNKLRCDVIVYSKPVSEVRLIPEISERLKLAVLVAEIKRDSTKRKTGIKHQLEPALHQIPSLSALGVYWDDVNRILLVKKTTGQNIELVQDDISNLPEFMAKYKERPVTFNQLIPPDNLVAVLYELANIMRSHGVNDERLRYKETVKLILARYCDERESQSSGNKELRLQVRPGTDKDFRKRADQIYGVSAKRYSNAKTLFSPVSGSELDDDTLRDITRQIQGIHFTAASSEMMQQLFMSFVPVVFKKSLDQYFTPISLINCIISMVRIGPNDKVADPGMGTADFLTAALTHRLSEGDPDIDKRLFGMDVDPMAYDLAVINMILHKDGQTGLKCDDSIKNHAQWNNEIDVALCNPPFGENSVERRPEVLKNYELGHQWVSQKGKWQKTEVLLAKQQLGILFLERCFKLLGDGGRIAIILPEGYLSTPGYGYVRQWIVNNLRIVSLIELPRRIFLKSDADLRSSVLVLEKHSPVNIKALIKADYPIHAELVRKVGYKMGAGFSVIAKRDSNTGEELRDDDNKVVMDTDFTNVKDRNYKFVEEFQLNKSIKSQVAACKKPWIGGRISNVLSHSALDIKPRRLSPNALENIRRIKSGDYVRLGDIADVIGNTIDIANTTNKSELWQLIEGQDIRAVDGAVIAQEAVRGWLISERKGRSVYKIELGDIIVGLVRPERRNVGMVVSSGHNLVGSPDGIAVVRLKENSDPRYNREWLFATLRSESVRLQFWTESGGTSYGKLTEDQIENTLLPYNKNEANSISATVKEWFDLQTLSLQSWSTIGTESDRKPILNSPIFGLEWPGTEIVAEFGED